MLDLLMRDILGTPAILLGIFALVGLLLQKKDIATVVSGTLKTIMGFIIIGAGAGVIIAALEIFSKMFDQAFSIRGIIPNNEAIVAVAQDAFGVETAMIMVFGMVMNIVLARFTPFKYIFLTGHHTLFMASLLAAILSVSGLSGVLLVVVGSVLLGLCMVLFPALLQPFVRQITGSDDFAVGHFGSLGYFISGTIGKYAGNKEHSTEQIKVPKQLGFLRDTSVAVSLTMTLLFVVVALFAGPGFIEKELSSGSNYIVFSIIQAITFAAGVYIVLAGVRMLISEIVPAFKGIADKLVPNAKPALDCPTVFPFAPNAVIIGFLSSFVAGLISMFFLPLLGLSIIVPGLVPHFFTGAAAGVFGNATGGRRGAILGSFANGILISFLPAFLLPLLGNLGFEGTTFGDSDFAFVGILISWIVSLFS
ncbi:PTS ascorbate transporter subunit IIC [Exiguobacterium sp. MH3]|uniref:PTS ascorbate transporter subunit IIC n=1 Tax=Exiguobacterium sp. MH3 TaxID=1399115 RepID=UPI0003C3C295|nr:PTS ascorbate transporter subunit IIC [Exiguobacterium sp. MH3]AHA29552.1 PTS beta-glucoside transporter subunit IIBC [Exiguobacterium sp. MH3]